MAFNANITLEIDHFSGPEINDNTHIVNWLVADGLPTEGEYGGFQFSVCPKHADSEECDCGDEDEVSTYQASILTADLES